MIRIRTAVLALSGLAVLAFGGCGEGNLGLTPRTACAHGALFECSNPSQFDA